MSEITVSASELRDKSADLLERVERGQGRVLIRKYNKDQAYLISARELRALEETVAVLENQELMRFIERGKQDMKAGRVQDASEAFAELDAEFQDGDQ